MGAGDVWRLGAPLLADLERGLAPTRREPTRRAN